MSEIDWQRLADEHEKAPEQDSAEWLSALADFDEDPAERERALDADPLLLFRGLPEEETGPADIEAMKQAVASMRAAKDSLNRVDGVGRTTAAERESRRKWAVAAMFALVVSIAGLTGTTETTEPLPTWDQAYSAAPADSVPIEIAQLPLVEDVGPEMGPLMQIEGDGVSVVVVMAGGGDLPPDNEDA